MIGAGSLVLALIGLSFLPRSERVSGHTPVPLKVPLSRCRRPRRAAPERQS
jgi:hypothetical protein